MAIRNLPTRRGVAPQGVTGVNWGSPLTRGLTNLFLLNTPSPPICLVTGAVGVNSTTAPVVEGSPLGAALRGHEATTTYVDVPVIINTSGQQTIVLGIAAKPGFTPVVDERIFDNGTTDNNPPRLEAKAGGATYGWDTKQSGTNSQVSIARLSPVGAFEAHALGIDYTATTTLAGFDWVVNGVPQTMTLVQAGAGSTLEPPLVRLLGILAAARGWEGWMMYWGKYNRRLSANELASVTTNPWQLFAPKRKVFAGINAAGATAVTLSGPSSGAVNAASTNFTAGVDATPITGTVTVTPTDSSGNGTFSPTTVSLTTGSPTATFTYTPTTTGARNINCTNNGSLANPSNIVYTANGQVAQLTLVTSPSDLTPRAGLTGLAYAWFDQTTPNNFVAPTDKGTGASTDGSGVLTLTLVNTTKTSGQVGWLIVSNSDGTVGQTPAELAFSGPVALN